MAYPDTIPAFRDALLSYIPAEDHEAAIYEAQAQASPVAQSVRVFETLKTAESLSNDGLGLLLGAATLIASNGWHGLAGEAVALIAARSADYVHSPEE